MSPFFALFITLLLASSAYAAGRLHGQLSYRLGYRFGFRQGFLDGDRGAWNRRRQEAQANKPSPFPNKGHHVMGTARGRVYVTAGVDATQEAGAMHRA